MFNKYLSYMRQFKQSNDFLQCGDVGIWLYLRKFMQTQKHFDSRDNQLFRSTAGMTKFQDDLSKFNRQDFLIKFI